MKGCPQRAEYGHWPYVVAYRRVFDHSLEPGECLCRVELKEIGSSRTAIVNVDLLEERE